MVLAPQLLRVLLADDERLARSSLRNALQEIPDVSIVAECESGREAEETIRTLLPDIAFLDINMPDTDGLDIVRELGPKHACKIIFVTAYDEYALDAFQVHAFDYVLKPIDSARVRLAVERAREQIMLEGRGNGTHPPSNGHEGRPAGHYLERLAIDAGQRLMLLDVADVNWVEAWGDYVRIHAHGHSFTVREKISDLEHQLDPDRFARIHRSAIVQIARIKDLAPLLHGDYELTLTDNTLLRLSRTYRRRLSELLQHHL